MTFWGFTDRFSPKEKALAERRLSAIGKCTTVLFEGKKISPPEYIRQLVKQGGDLMCEPIDSRRKEFKIYVNAEVPCLDGTKEHVSAKDKKVFTSLTKTQYNFAVYLRLNHFDDDEVAREFERKEQEDSLKREKEQDEAIHEEEARKKRFDTLVLPADVRR